MKYEIEEPFGPEYPRHLGATVAKFRRATKKAGLAALDRDERRAYGDAVEKAILALQRREAGYGLPPVTLMCNCASGTAHNTGAAIHAAILRRQRAALANAAGQERRARTPKQWTAMYEAAMAAKRRRKALARQANTDRCLVDWEAA